MVFIDGKFAGPVLRFERWFGPGPDGIDVVFYRNRWGYPTAEAMHRTNVVVVRPD